MQHKSAREYAGVTKLVAHYRSLGRGQWTSQRGADPPDFIIINRDTGEIAAVEHTSFIWPTNEIGWDHAVKGLMDDVRAAVKNKIKGLLALEIDQVGIQGFQRDYAEMSKRKGISKWLADEIVRINQELDVGQTRVLRGPLIVTIAQRSWTGGGDVGLVRSISKGNDLGFSLAVAFPSERLIIERIDKPDSALKCYEEILDRKAARLGEFTQGSRVLLIDDYSMSIENLIYLMKVMDVPSMIDELYIWAVRDRILVEFPLRDESRVR